MKKLFIILSLLIATLAVILNACSAAAPTTTFHAPTTTLAPTYTLTPAPSDGGKNPITITNVPAPTIAIPGTTTAPTYSSSAQGQNNLGLSTGGAKDVNNFRENIRNNYLPLPTDITYEGLFYDYFFDMGTPPATDKLFAPSYSYAVTRDPLSGQTEYYLAVGLNSGMKEEDFARKKLNLVILIDDSGSMGELYTQYYYDSDGIRRDAYEGEGTTHQTKMNSADEAVVSILNQLQSGDRFAIVAFNGDASVVKTMGTVDGCNMGSVKNTVMGINAGGNTNLSAGIQHGDQPVPQPARSQQLRL